MEHAALEPLFCEYGEIALDRVEPGRRGGSEVEYPARMASTPLAHLWMFVGRIIVDDGVDQLARRYSPSIALRKRMNS